MEGVGKGEEQSASRVHQVDGEDKNILRAGTAFHLEKGTGGDSELH